MALADTGRAIGAVSWLIRDYLFQATKLHTDVGRPSTSTGSYTNGRLNLYLYEASFDPHLRNHSLDSGRKPPLWLVLKYLLTAYDEAGVSDTVNAHQNLGTALQALQMASFLQLPAPLSKDPGLPLSENPEALKLTFDEVGADLLSKIMQGKDEKYTFSVGFQIRPILVIPDEPVQYSLLVGVDYTQTPPAAIDVDSARNLSMLVYLAPSLQSFSPAKIETTTPLLVRGGRLNLPNLALQIGPVEIAVKGSDPLSLQIALSPSNFDPTQISAGRHPLSLVQRLGGGVTRTSEILMVELLPTLTNASFGTMTHVNASDPSSAQYGPLTLNGALLGTAQDDVVVALYQDGAPARVLQGAFTFAADQTSLTLAISDSSAVPSGTYQVILRVNGEQAKSSPKVVVT